MPVKPVFVVGGLYSLSNGVAWIMRDLAAALGRQSAPVTVCAADCWGRGADSVGHVFEKPSTWVTSRGIWLGGLSWSPLLKRKMSTVIGSADIVHNHSLWMLPNSYGSRIAARSNKPVVISAHGALEPWAMENSGWKKQIVGGLFQNRDLRRADCIHVNSLPEADGVRRYGLKGPVAVIPNGIHLPDYENLGSSDAFAEKFPETNGKLVALFMARINKKKGLGHLIPAWGRIEEAFPDWHLVIAGPDNGFEPTARGLVQAANVEGSVTFTGPLQGGAKREALAAAEVFVQPSFSEGFSMAVIEALACRIPVLITPGCNFPEVSEARAGVCVEPNVDQTEEGLRKLLSLPDEERRAMGNCGRALVESAYTWDHVASTTLSVYRWLMGGGPAPDCIIN